MAGAVLFAQADKSCCSLRCELLMRRVNTKYDLKAESGQWKTANEMALTWQLRSPSTEPYGLAERKLVSKLKFVGKLEPVVED